MNSGKKICSQKDPKTHNF